MKKIKAILSLLFTSTLLVCVACKNNEKTENEDPLKAYELIYNGTSKELAPIIKNEEEFNRASYCYRFNNMQGYNGWNLIKQVNNARELLTHSVHDWTSSNGTKLTDEGIIYTNPGEYIGFEYVIPSSGNYTFAGTLIQNESDKNIPCSLIVTKNGTQIYPMSEVITTTTEDERGRYIQNTFTFNADDIITFLVTGDNVYFNPSIRKGNNMEDTMYNSHTDWTYYGDIHAYYHNDTLHLYHLWNHDWSNNGWVWYMQTTQDMYRYKTGDYDESFLKDHYMAYGKTSDVVDYSIYTSARDCTTFFDSDVKRYRSIGLGYKPSTNGEIDCDLFLRTSNDEIGFEWFDHAIPLRSFPKTKDGEPECSQLIKLGNRWYLTTGISGQSIHGVGTLSYWIGDEGKTIDEVDWQSKETHKLDGEDLAVPQIEKVRDKYYLFGWMPQLYNGGNWGGYKNLAREVYVKEDGTLGTRFDPMATKLMNKGKLFDVTKDNTTSGVSTVEKNNITIPDYDRVKINETVGQAFVKYTVEMGTATQFDYVMNDGYNDWRCSIIEENGKAYLKIHIQDGFVSSQVYLSEVKETYDVKLVTHGTIIEFAVNDTIVLSGRTGMSGMNYTPSFISNGSANIKNLSINRLAQLYDVYD